MRQLDYLSPSGINKYIQSKDQFYLDYLCAVRGPREPQTQPMSIGSAFDAYVKSYLHEKLFGKDNDPRYNLEALFEAQVEPPLRDWAWENGAYAFEQYKQAGCLGDLMLMLSEANGPPRFEFEVKGVINGYRDGIKKTIGAVTLLGKPDCLFISKGGNHCVLDFKVNGYCSNYPKSPLTHYIILRSAGRTSHGRHQKCMAYNINGMEVNCACFLENLEQTWARQSAIYGWLTGAPVGSEFVCIHHQLCCSPNVHGLPNIKIAEHHNKIGPDFQRDTFNLACEIVESVKNNHYYKELSQEESIKRCQLLEGSFDEPPLINIQPNVRAR